MKALLSFLIQWTLAAGFTFLVEDTNIAIEIEESITLMSLYYDNDDMTPEYCKEKTQYLSEAIADTVTRADHDCDRFGVEYNLYLDRNNAFLAEFRHVCAKIANMALYEDSFEIQKYPVCTINITSLNLMQERIHNLGNLLTSFTYWKCEHVLAAAGPVKSLYSMQLAQYFTLLHLSMQEIIYSFQHGYQTLHQLSLRTPYQLEVMIYDCIKNSKPVSDIQVQQCHMTEEGYFCLIELTHKNTQLIPAFAPVTYAGYSLEGPVIGFTNDEYGKIVCDKTKCLFYPFSSKCSEGLISNNVQMIVWNCPFIKHDNNKNILETPKGVLIQDDCQITMYNDTYEKQLSYNKPILINSYLRVWALSGKCKGM